MTEDATVLVVDDEPRVCQAFDLWLQETYRVVTATSGEAALERMDDSVDVVLLDRHMPGMSGDEVLTKIRDAGYNCRVAMVTAVDPDFDIVDMPFDHYVSKPVDGGTLEDVIDGLLGIEQYDSHMADLYGVTQKVATLEAEKSRTELSRSEEYADLVDRREALRGEMNDIMATLDADDVEQLFEVAAGCEREE
jgi:DNA-binding response OmpR family regulator